MKKEPYAPALLFLLLVTGANYIAQVPYYLHNYYIPYHVLPSPSSIILLGLTLAWFITGYLGVVNGKHWARPVLISFLVAEALFYLHSVVFGAFFFQMQNPSLLIKTVFLIGYMSGVVSAYYAYALIRFHPIAAITPIVGTKQ
jgi:hypothetical protein